MSPENECSVQESHQKARVCVKSGSISSTIQDMMACNIAVPSTQTKTEVSIIN